MMNKPKVSIKLENETFKVLEIKGKRGDILNSHKVDTDAVLQLLSGLVLYSEGNKSISIQDGCTHPIPKQQLHKLEFMEDSSLLLFLSNKAKMKFLNK